MNVPLIIGIIILLAGLGGGGYWYFFMRRVYEGPSDCLDNKQCLNETVATLNHLVSPNGSYELKLLKNGNLTIIDRSGSITWESKSGGIRTGPYYVKMQGDGNLVMYGAGGPTWASGTSGKGVGPFTLRLDDKGHLNILNNNKSVLWST